MKKEEKYNNPIIFADYSDPDVICVEDSFFMVSSSFTYVPGVPLLYSKDLVHWKLINYCVKRIPLKRYDRPAHGAGTWAPSIRYHDGMFYVFIPMPDEGIFVVKAEDPYGEWSEMYCLKKAKGWIDPCPFWDDDGKAYIVFAYAASRCGKKHLLSICEMNDSVQELQSEPVIIYDGVQENPTIEGPKLYKKDGWYYIFAPAGGVEDGWQTILRSKHIYGPYESRIVLHQGNTQINGPHQGAYIQSPWESEYFLHFQDRGPYGRILHLQPLCWKNGWPFIGTEQNGDGIGEPVKNWDVLSDEADCYEICRDDFFYEDAPGLIWQWQSNPVNEWYSLDKKQGNLRLYTIANEYRSENLLWYAPNACTQIIFGPETTADICMTFHGDQEKDMAGIGIIGHVYSWVGVVKESDGLFLELWEGRVLEEQGEGEAKEEKRWSCPLVKTGDVTIYLRLQIKDNAEYQYAYSENGLDYTFIPLEQKLVRATWTGAKFTLIAINLENRKSVGYGDYNYVKWT